MRRRPGQRSPVFDQYFDLDAYRRAMTGTDDSINDLQRCSRFSRGASARTKTERSGTGDESLPTTRGYSREINDTYVTHQMRNRKPSKHADILLAEIEAERAAGRLRGPFHAPHKWGTPTVDPSSGGPVGRSGGLLAVPAVRIAFRPSRSLSSKSGRMARVRSVEAKTGLGAGTMASR